MNNILNKALQYTGTHNQAIALGIDRYQIYKDDKQYNAMRVDEDVMMRLFYYIIEIKKYIRDVLLVAVDDANQEQDEKRRKRILACIESNEARVSELKPIYNDMRFKHSQYAESIGYNLKNPAIIG